MNYLEWLKNRKPNKNTTACPDCGGKVQYYHDTERTTRIVCKKKCNGWKVIEESRRNNNENM